MKQNKNISSSSEQKRFYIVSVRYENYKQIREDHFSRIGFPGKGKRPDDIKIGDKLVLYVGSRKSIVVGVLEVTSKMIWSNELVWDDIFPKRFETKPILVLPEKKGVDMRDIKNGLSFINPSIKKFGVYFMTGLKEINEDDYIYIYEKLKKAYGDQIK